MRSDLGYLIALDAVTLLACGAPTPSDARAESTADGPSHSLARLRAVGRSTGDDTLIVDDDTFIPSCESGSNIFLLTADNTILAFDPLRTKSRELGQFACETESTVNSMAVQRDGTAWIGYHDGSLFLVDPRTLECTASDHDPKVTEGSSFGEAFVSNGPGTDAETLFLVGGHEGTAVGRLIAIDPTTLAAKRIGTLGTPLNEGWCELTGTGEGVLATFCPLDVVPESSGQRASKLSTRPRTHFAFLNKQNADIGYEEPLPFGAVYAFALAHWGGGFYIFTATPTTQTRVDLYIPGKGVKRQGFLLPGHVVGAGVSTCAPVASRIAR